MIKTANLSDVCRVGWGTGTSFGLNCTEYEAAVLIYSCLNAGINLLDTGPNYCRGMSETLLGKSLSTIGADRKSIFISTKFGSFSTFLPFGSNFKVWTEEALRCSMMRSLDRLQTDYIDLLLFHGLPDIDQAELLLDIMQDLKRQKLVRYCGFSAHGSKELEMFLFSRQLRPDVIMSHFNLLNSERVGPILSSLSSNGITILGSAPFAHGLLSSRRRFKRFADLRRDLFYTARLLRSRVSRKNISKTRWLADSSSIVSKQLYPLDFSLRQSYIDHVVCGTLSTSSFTSYQRLATKYHA